MGITERRKFRRGTRGERMEGQSGGSASCVMDGETGLSQRAKAQKTNSLGPILVELELPRRKTLLVRHWGEGRRCGKNGDTARSYLLGEIGEGLRKRSLEVVLGEGIEASRHVSGAGNLRTRGGYSLRIEKLGKDGAG